jgi:FKBP-type peptidyl-prolyl cis-trans isomerase FkpA
MNLQNIFVRTASIMIAVLITLPLQAAEDQDDKVFYFLGTILSRNLVNLNLSDSELNELIKGLRAGVAGDAEKLDEAVYGEKLNAMGQARMAAASANEASASTAYLDKMAAEKGAVTTASGMIYLEQTAGSGEQPTATSTVVAHYKGTLRDGTVFDSSYDRGQPLTIPLNRVIPCWTEAISMMKPGGKSKITCPSDIAYGDQGSGEIPPGAALTFEVELISIQE